ncbi:hypothetical protein HZ994_11505 [Akkermansiaceae bacterium]|nr:hypothetical protein HZ994_11505 [Akkermansiaceae bacterium]
MGQGGLPQLIQPTFEQPGYKHFNLKPNLTPELQWAKTSMQSPYGTSGSNWKSSPETFGWTIDIPSNSSATLSFPYQDGRQLREGGLAVNTATRLIKEGRRQWLQMKAGSGLYHFTLGAKAN